MQKLETKMVVKDFMSGLEGKVLEVGWTLGRVISELFKYKSCEKYCIVDDNGIFLGVSSRFDIEQEIRIMEAKYTSTHAHANVNSTNSQNLGISSFGGGIGTSSSTPGNVVANQVPFEFEKVTIDASVPMVSPHQNLNQIHRLFSVLRYQRVFVISMGKLIGMITLRSLQEAMQSHAKKLRRFMRKQKYEELRRESVCSSVVSSEEDLNL